MRSIVFVVAGFALATTLVHNQSVGAVQMEATSRSLEIRGSEPGDYFGRPVVCGDFDGDGIGDIAVCDDRSTFPAHRSTIHIIRGRSNWSPDLIALTSTTVTAGADAVILGETGSTNLATSLAAGDVNGDGKVDLVAADPSISLAGRPSSGSVYVIFGGTSFFSQPVRDLALGQWGVKFNGAVAGDDTGASSMFGGQIAKALAVGDLTGDGIGDIAVGAHLADANSRSDSGKVIVVRGRNNFVVGSTIDLAVQSDATILGKETYAEMGTAVEIGDVNGDSIGDLVLGENYGSVGLFTTEGRVHIIFGSSSFSSRNLLTQAASVTIIGKGEWEELGAGVAIADINGDGRKDVIAGAPGWDPVGGSSADYGAVYAFFGRTTWPATITLATQSADLFVQGFSNANIFGSDIAAGDFNGDGIGDFMFSSRDAARAGYSAEGRNYVLYGATSLGGTRSIQNEEVDVIINGGANLRQLGDTVAAGDVNGDGAAEILLAAPFLDASTGRLYGFDLSEERNAATDWRLFE